MSVFAWSWSYLSAQVKNICMRHSPPMRKSPCYGEEVCNMPDRTVSSSGIVRGHRAAQPGMGSAKDKFVKDSLRLHKSTMPS